ncbi:SRPBCC domain-containing protein [Pseudooceanicola sp. CBS1P-1]|uniref:Polyketide cyclase n=1 Tax=Pseudooceanicola albus TaxID=2692189 RepID=A0A6L7GBR5_9RHOB|nr:MULTISPECIES: SRPBCC domain-containing protein [Pseudooceanicola]MBT9386921.1 SRPBCC domain-containing protein [Pseudooceanicola endophyticus]MXN21027.1 polyketide cyclase [Pseudooceanicola albus]
MSLFDTVTPDPALDLTLVRRLDCPPALPWRLWTEDALLQRWFTPAPVRTTEARVEPFAGGRFFTRMEMPDGTEIASEGCVLQALPWRLLVFTDTLGPGFRPKPGGFMTGFISFTPSAGGTLYEALVRHATEEDRKTHEEMGFDTGWNAATDQLAAEAQKLKA